MERWRFVTIAVLLVVLAALFVMSDDIEPSPARNDYPGAADIYEHPERYVGDRVSLRGTVVETDPLTIETQPAPGERMTFVVEDTTAEFNVGDSMVLFGTLREDNHVETINVVPRRPWELTYMYIVSFVAGLWVLARLLNGWTVDTSEWAIVPRSEPVVTLR